MTNLPTAPDPARPAVICGLAVAVASADSAKSLSTTLTSPSTALTASLTEGALQSLAASSGWPFPGNFSGALDTKSVAIVVLKKQTTTWEYLWALAGYAAGLLLSPGGAAGVAIAVILVVGGVAYAAWRRRQLARKKVAPGGEGEEEGGGRGAEAGAEAGEGEGEGEEEDQASTSRFSFSKRFQASARKSAAPSSSLSRSRRVHPSDSAPGMDSAPSSAAASEVEEEGGEEGEGEGEGQGQGRGAHWQRPPRSAGSTGARSQPLSRTMLRALPSSRPPPSHSLARRRVRGAEGEGGEEMGDGENALFVDSSSGGEEVQQQQQQQQQPYQEPPQLRPQPQDELDNMVQQSISTVARSRSLALRSLRKGAVVPVSAVAAFSTRKRGVGGGGGGMGGSHQLRAAGARGLNLRPGSRSVAGAV
jgi:hypothetical protein